MPSAHPLAQALGDRVRAERQRRELTLEDLSALAEVHWTNLGKIERGQSIPGLETVVRIAVALNLDPAALVTGFGAELLPSRTHRLTARDFLAERAARDGDGSR